jgi:hypothetical protein
MSIPLTFADKRLVETVLVGPDGGVHYTTTSTRGFGGRKLTTITAASGLTGFINWREKALVLKACNADGICCDRGEVEQVCFPFLSAV